MQVKFLSTYLKVGLDFILVTEIQVMAINIEDTKKSDLPRSDFRFSRWWQKPNVQRQLSLQLLLPSMLLTHMYYGLHLN
jgi:hypothetical protein